MEDQKPKKAPGFYKKIISEKKLETRYLKYIEIPVDKSFIRDCYEKQEDGLHIRGNLGADEAKRLKALVPAIKKNRKWVVNFMPLIIVGGIAAAAVLFFTAFANPLLGRALEMGLEGVFEARADVKNFRLSILKFEISMSGLTIADKDSPGVMFNLVEFGRIAFKMKPNAVLRGKIYIEEISADTIRFGTPRKVSGALPYQKAPKVVEEKEPIVIPPMVDLANFDAMALLNQEFDKLQTPKLYNEAITAYKTASEKWKGQADLAKTRVAELQDQTKSVLALNINEFIPNINTKNINVKDLAAAQKDLAAAQAEADAAIKKVNAAISEIEDLTKTVQKSVDEVSGIVTGAQNDFNAASGLIRNVRNNVTADLNHLKSYVDFSSGAAMEVLEPVIQDLLTDTAKTYLDYGSMALEILEKVKEFQANLPASEPKEKKEKFRGRDVVYPTKSYPVFYLGKVASDVKTQSGWHWGFDLESISSDPYYAEKPATLNLSLKESGDGLNRTAALNGVVDFRSNAEYLYTANFTGGGFPVNLGSQLKQAGIGGFDGNAGFEIGLKGQPKGDFTGAGKISIANSRITDPANTITQAVSKALTQINSLDLGLEYKHYTSSKDSFSMKSNINDIVQAALKNMVDEYKEKAFREIERVLNEKLGVFADELGINQKDMEALLKVVQGDKAAMDQLKNTLTNKKNELDHRARSAINSQMDAAKKIAEDAAKQVLDEAKTQAEKAVQDALKGNVPQMPSLPTPSLPKKLF
ncbi:MAG: hypothetical protein LBH43_00125 [Treponema sp.]|jgi:hypothetical protein|nr:hypothetical protein [Treponema sp.]